jgi:ferric-chelate reductase
MREVEETDEQLSWPDIPSQILRYSADRTGIMAFANFPLIWLFGGRNNIFLWATGWSFASFNIFHRHVARVATLQAIVHSLLYIVMYIQGKIWTCDLPRFLTDLEFNR